uniref:Uncharacterized protein n=1 Tax=Moumouvirus sp. 'Monve' TaxID=1128131 RepID=H2EF81_9VIRU|nr:hypothetical protein mv_R944 [Moumouvirus Monve]
MSYHCSSSLILTNNNTNNYLATNLTNIFHNAQMFIRQYYQYYKVNNFYQKRYPFK